MDSYISLLELREHSDFYFQKKPPRKNHSGVPSKLNTKNNLVKNTPNLFHKSEDPPLDLMVNCFFNSNTEPFSKEKIKRNVQHSFFKSELNHMKPKK
ncbi:unnamed protein product [Nezara viridula]|uniref:Uncharacterized protein n=1 Tax=Nezara viridula TaxID=85310 RepID=A0A9P0MT49_NEZVI|nr:unnamed protein product [Nezara viridula]